MRVAVPCKVSVGIEHFNGSASLDVCDAHEVIEIRPINIQQLLEKIDEEDGLAEFYLAGQGCGVSAVFLTRGEVVKPLEGYLQLKVADDDGNRQSPTLRYLGLVPNPFGHAAFFTREEARAFACGQLLEGPYVVSD